MTFHMPGRPNSIMGSLGRAVYWDPHHHDSKELLKERILIFN